MNQPRHVTRAQLIEAMHGHPILIRPKGLRLITMSESAKRALAREIGLAICQSCHESVVVGDNAGAALIDGKCARCARLQERVDDLPPAA